MNGVIRIGVLGTARVVPYGLVAPAKETPGVEVTGIASRNQQKAAEFAERHAIPRAFDSYDALVTSPDIDAVYVALPPALHYEWARRAIEAGKHVLCEKPLAINARLAEQLALLARERGRVLLEAMHIRYAEKLRRQRELAAGGELGRVLRIDACFRTPYMPMPADDFRRSLELGGGAALDVGCYAVSCLRYIAGEEPEILSARHKSSSPQVDRWMRAELRFPSGAAGAVEFGYRGLYLPRGGVVVTCENGWSKWRGDGIAYAKDGSEVREAFPAQSTYRHQLAAFANSIRGEASDALAPDDSVQTARVLDAIFEKGGLAVRGSPLAA